MFSKVLILVSVSVLISLLAFSFTGGGLYYSRQEILIESEESKTKNLTSVFNKIKWISLPNQDIWMMNQSHYGVHATKDQWERLAIVIDKTKKPMTAKFYQLEPGPLEWSEDLKNKRTPYRASCFICHSNGPRAIRPVSKSQEVNLSYKEKMRLVFWNLRIKTYGRIDYDKSHDQEDLSLETPFHLEGKSENAVLKVKTCTLCHKEDGFFARGVLRRQQTGTINSLVNNGHMPPPGFFLSPKEKRELKDFMRGF